MTTPSKRALRESVDGERGLVSELDAADVALAHVGIDLHPGEVGGDEKQRRRLEARRDGLPHRDVAGNDGAVDRGHDVGVFEVDLRGIENRLAQLDRGFIEGDLCLGLIVDALRIVVRVLRDGA